MSNTTMISPAVNQPPSFQRLQDALAVANISLLHAMRNMHATMPAQAKMLASRSLTVAESDMIANLTDSSIRALGALVKPRMNPCGDALRNYLINDDPGQLLGALMLDARLSK